MMILAMLAFMTNDMLVKLASFTLPLGQILTIRSLLALGFLLVFVDGTHLYRIDKRLLVSKAFLARHAGEAGASFFYLSALFLIPIANAASIMQIVPLSVTAAGALFLKESVGWRRWLAIILGLVGVLLVIQPGLAGFNLASLMVILAVGFVTLRDIASRVLPVTISSLIVTFFTSIFMLAFGLILGLFESWTLPDAETWAYLCLSSLSILAGFYGVTEAMRHGETAVVAPFRYTAIIWATLYGLFIFNDTMNGLTIVGIAFIIAAGLYSLRRRKLAALSKPPILG